MSDVVSCAADLIFWMGERGWKCYVEKGTNRSGIDKTKKAVILDISDPNFLKNAELAKMKVDAIITKRRMRAAAKAP